jgi:hypothetical protein
MLQIMGKDERVRVWRLQRELVSASVMTCDRTGEKHRRVAKGTDRRDPHRGYDRP